MGQRSKVEKLWREFFSDPLQWWDHRPEKVSPRYPDFKHRKTKQSLWLIDKSNPPWVKEELAAMAPGILHPNIFSWNRKLARHVKAGEPEKTMKLFQQMQKEGMNPDKFTFIPVLNACSNLRALEDGRRVHKQIVESGSDSDLCVSNCLVDMYAKCGSIDDAQRVFTNMPIRDVVSWNAMILGHVKCGEGQKALELSRQMHGGGLEPNTFTFVGMLNACSSVASLEEGQRVHEQIIQNGCESNIFVGNCLVDMYAKCGSIEDAEKVFNNMPMRDVISWNAMILGYVKGGQGRKALKLFQQVHVEGMQPNTVTFVAVLNACASLGALGEGCHVHEQIIQRGCESNIYVASSLVDMYAKCGSIEDAQRVFNNMPRHDVVAWNAMILGYVKCVQGQKALDLFWQIYGEGVKPGPVTFIGVLNACASLGLLGEGRRVHELIIETGCESDVFVGSSLVDMYSKCGSIEDARSVFNHMPARNVVSWSAMIMGYLKCGEGQKALELYWQMHEEEVEPNPVSFMGALNACALVARLADGRRIHEQIIQRGYESDALVGNCLVDMYSKCGCIEDAWRVFKKMPTRNVVAWSSMIIGFVKCGEGQLALELFHSMQQEGVKPNPVTFVGVLNACASIGALEEGLRVHDHIIRSGCESDIFLSNSLIDMYSKCGSIVNAQKVFENMPLHDTVSWSTMIMGYGKCGDGHKALQLFQQMQQEGLKPDRATFLGVLNTCASVAALEEGRRVHRQVIGSNYEADVAVGNSLVDMYAKCGSLEDAWRTFNSMSTRDVVSWNTMLGGYAIHGQAMEALQHFERMCQGSVGMNEVTFISLLSAFSHGGLVDEGLHFFELMRSAYSISVTVEHYACMVDLLGRSGHLHDAEELIKTMSCEPNASIWRTLLGACRVHGVVEMGDWVAKKVLELDPKKAAGYVLLSNIYAASGKWDSSAKLK